MSAVFTPLRVWTLTGVVCVFAPLRVWTLTGVVCVFAPLRVWTLTGVGCVYPSQGMDFDWCRLCVCPSQGMDFDWCRLCVCPSQGMDFDWCRLCVYPSQGMDFDWCRQPEVGLPRPDAVVLLQLSAAAAATRAAYGLERYEHTDFQRKVAAHYDTLQEPDWIVSTSSSAFVLIASTKYLRQHN